ncbi:MAG: discoidin domain-containing protein [Trueperaceae bacterium]
MNVTAPVAHRTTTCTFVGGLLAALFLLMGVAVAQPSTGELERTQAPPPAVHDLGPILEAPPALIVLEPTRAVLRLDTTVPLACVVAFGTDASFGRLAQDPMMGAIASRDHEVTLDDLTPDTTYLLRFQGSAASGRFYASATFRFRTPPADEATGDETSDDEASRPDGMGPARADLSVREVSSEFGAGFSAEAALNGASGAWSSAGDGDDAFLTVGLPESSPLAGTTVHTRTMTDSGRITRFRLVTDDGTVLGPFDLPDAERAYAFRFDAPVTASSVRFEVVASTGGNTGLVRFDLHPPE